MELADTAVHRERDGDVHVVGVIEVGNEVRKERVVSAADDRAVVRRSFYGWGEDLVAHVREYVTHAAARVGNVVGVARDDV